MAKGNRVDFWLVLNYFVVYEAYFLVGEFLVELLELQVLFLLLCLIFCLRLVWA
jgi:hypothetical protein